MLYFIAFDIHNLATEILFTMVCRLKTNTIKSGSVPVIYRCIVQHPPPPSETPSIPKQGLFSYPSPRIIDYIKAGPL